MACIVLIDDIDNTYVMNDDIDDIELSEQDLRIINDEIDLEDRDPNFEAYEDKS